MTTMRVRRDKYKGLTVSVDGCDHPWKRSRMMYQGTRRRGWDRRVAMAVALNVVAGSERARRYLVRRDWAPAKAAPPFYNWPVLEEDR
jgi:hypothetical protein